MKEIEITEIEKLVKSTLAGAKLECNNENWIGIEVNNHWFVVDKRSKDESQNYKGKYYSVKRFTKEIKNRWLEVRPYIEGK